NVTETTPCACAAGVCTVRVTGTANYNGAASFDYTVTANGLTAAVAETATLTISAVNDAPVFGTVLADTDGFGATPTLVSFSLSDVDSTVACNSTYLSMSSSNTTLVPNANVVWSGTAPNCVATITGADSHTTGGTSTIALSVSDGSLSDNDDFVLTLKPQELSAAVETMNTVIADYDQDGDNDVAIYSRWHTGYPNGLVTIYFGNGDGTFD